MIEVMRCTKAIIHLENLRHNIRLLKEILSPAVSICMAVKADAYGHGAVRVTWLLRFGALDCQVEHAARGIPIGNSDQVRGACDDIQGEAEIRCSSVIRPR